jgi:7,8-dihydropterin-6-yl-methyl-4-(beta-D-ribofuranosyl)aminobenzene 5'-phosphate synthase
MAKKVKVTILVENSAESRGLLAEHGLAYWIEVGSQHILFDTGQGEVLLSNAQRLGAPLHQVDIVVISHGHYDHTGGLANLLRGSRPAMIFLHPDARKPKFAESKDGSSREIGIPPACEQALQQYGGSVVLTDEPKVVSNGLMVTGPVPRTTDFEDTGGPFFLDADCRKPDPLVDDQAVFFESSRGTVVLLGCAHAGVINTLRFVRQLTNQQPIYAVLGGMHLVGASAHRLTATIDEMRQLQIDGLGPAHCTGRAATAALWDAFPNQCVPCHVGAEFKFDVVPRSVTKAS